jgi:hypothetical protein
VIGELTRVEALAKQLAEGWPRLTIEPSEGNRSDQVSIRKCSKVLIRKQRLDAAQSRQRRE